MDVKAMAKSKRSHTQHHQPKKPHHTSTTSSSSNAPKSDKKRTTHRQQKPSLPSNWDRYEDEQAQEVSIESDSNDSSQHAAKAKAGADDAVERKSKGADFEYLVAQAKESQNYSLPSFDDNLPEFYQGVAPMLAVRGQKIMLENRDDDFLMEDEASGTQEAPFLTLDLQDLAERLSKIDLAKRLFIEPDFLPPELHGQDASKGDNWALFHTPERRNIERVDSFGELLALYLEEERMAKTQDDVDKDGMMSSSNVSSRHDPNREPELKADVAKNKINDLGYADARETLEVNIASEKDTKSKLDDVQQISHVSKEVTKSKLKDLDFMDEGEMHQASHATEQDTRPSSTFEGASAEAELDMLLGSFSETKLFDTPMNQPGTSASPMTGNIATHGAPLQHSLGQSAPAFPTTSSLDDELDDLLAETSKPNNEDGLPQSFEAPSSSLAQPSSKSVVLEDFDSWLDTI